MRHRGVEIDNVAGSLGLQIHLLSLTILIGVLIVGLGHLLRCHEPRNLQHALLAVRHSGLRNLRCNLVGGLRHVDFNSAHVFQFVVRIPCLTVGIVKHDTPLKLQMLAQHVVGQAPDG